MPGGCVGEGVMMEVSDEQVAGRGEVAHPMRQSLGSDEWSERTRLDRSNIAVQNLGYRNALRRSCE